MGGGTNTELFTGKVKKKKATKTSVRKAVKKAKKQDNMNRAEDMAIKLTSPKNLLGRPDKARAAAVKRQKKRKARAKTAKPDKHPN